MRPVLSMTEHEANSAVLWISDKLWQGLSAEQKQWVQTAARDVSLQEPKRAFELEQTAATKLEAGVKIVRRCRQRGFQKIADPCILDKLDTRNSFDRRRRSRGLPGRGALRQHGYGERICLINDEAHLPYQRPPLSKAYLKGEGRPDSLMFRPDKFYRDQDIELIGDRAAFIDRAARRLLLASGSFLDYGHLVLATGARIAA